MHRTTSAPSPINLITTWLFYIVKLCKARGKYYMLLFNPLYVILKYFTVRAKKRTSLVHIMGGFQRQQHMSPRSKAGQKWLAKVKKGSQVAPKDSIGGLSVVHLSPLGSQLSFSAQTTRIEHVTDWEAIAKKYRALMGQVDEVKESSNDDNDDEDEETQTPNNIMPPGGGN